jgi:hypothetical protein
MKFMLTCMLLLASVLEAAACPCAGNDDPCQCEPACQCQGVEDQVLVLPTDANKLYLTVIGEPGDEKFQQVRGWFKSDAALKAVKSQTHYNVISTDSKMFQRYAKSTGDTPLVRLQQPDGKVIFQVSGENLPNTPAQLERGFKFEWKRWKSPNGCPNGRCRPQPKPEPTPEPAPDEDEEITPDVQPDVEPVNDLPPIWLAAVVIAIGAALGVFKQFRETHPA